MRDLVLREALRAMAADAALRLHELVTSGDEVPYEVHEARDGSPLVQYTPRTAGWIRGHAPALRDLDSFGSGCAALESSGLAAPYLEQMDVAVPPDARARAELAGIVFLCRLWSSNTDFTLDDARLADTVEEVVALGEAAVGEIEIVVPLRGFQMPLERLQLASATIVSADAVDVPGDARAAEGMGGAGWEPTFLAVARLDATAHEDEASDLGARAVDAFRRLISTLRLFKAGGVALGPHAWTRIGGDRWRRISTGAGKPRPGGYRLADSELSELAGFSRALAGPSTPFSRAGIDRDGFPGTLARAVSRFEAGLERTVVLEALNDYLLATRFVLEGAGPASLGMPMRVAALCADPDGRAEVKSVIDRAVALERELWSGDPASRAAGRSPAETAAAVEDLIRAILKDAACGHLGSDLRATADEILLAEGFAVGEGAAAEQRGATAEWGDAGEDEAFEPARDELEEPTDDDFEEPADDLEDPAEDDFEAPADDDLEKPADDDLGGPGEEGAAALDEPEEPVRGLWFDEEFEFVDEFDAEEVSVAEQRSEAEFDESEIVITRAQNKIHELPAREPDAEPYPEPSSEPVFAEHDPFAEGRPDPAEPERPARRLHSVPADGPVAALIADSDQHRREVATRVSFLFPDPDTCEWQVPEVGYDRRRRAQVDDSAGAS